MAKKTTGSKATPAKAKAPATKNPAGKPRLKDATPSKASQTRYTETGLKGGGKNPRMTPANKKVPAIELVTLDKSMKNSKDHHLTWHQKEMESHAKRLDGKHVAAAAFYGRSKEYAEEIRDRKLTAEFKKKNKKK